MTEHHGEVVRSDCAGAVLPTVHPSVVLRTPVSARDRARREFFHDIVRAAQQLAVD